MKKLTKIVINFLLLLPLYCLSQKAVFEEVTVYTKDNEIELPGTLSYFEVKKLMPLALFTNSPNPIDRNGQQGHLMQGYYLKILTDSLTKNGISYNRYDKRTSNLEKADKHDGILPADFLADVQQTVHRHKTDKWFSSLPITGHSRGSLAGVLARVQHISYISIAGASRPINEILVEQVTKKDSTLGGLTAKQVKELAQTDAILSVNPFLLSLFAAQNQKFIKNWMSYETLKEIARFKLPILVINGPMDLQVSIVEAITLHGVSTTSTLELIHHMNHVFKTSLSADENLKSYMNPIFAIS